MIRYRAFLFGMFSLATASANEPETLVYRVVESHEVLLDVHRTDASGLRPTIFFIHGGALMMGHRGWTVPGSEYFLALGYNFVSIDYRLAPQVKLPAIIEDIRAAWDWVQDNGAAYGIDKNRIALMGKSAGGYLSLTGGYAFDPRPQAIVSFYGYGDLTGPWYTQPSDHYVSRFDPITERDAWSSVGTKVISAEPVDGSRFPFYLFSRQQGTWPQLVAGRSETDLLWFRDYEPLRNVAPDYPPTILLHGEVDTDVPFEQSRLMAAAFEKHNVPFEFVTRSDWNHGFDFELGIDDKSVADAYEKIAQFLDRHLK